MNEIDDLPEKQPMPAALRDRIWAEIEPQLEPPASRFRTLRAPLAAAAAVLVLALGVVVALPLLRGHDLQVAAGPDAQLVKQCLQAGDTVPDGETWRAGARLDLDPDHGYLMVRSDTAAGVCVIENGRGAGLIGSEAFDGRYGRLTAARPFDYLTSDNLDTESIHFGIVAGNVVTLSLFSPDNVTTPGVVRDGTFIVRTKIPEQSQQPTTNYVKVTLADGRTVTGPLRPN